MPEHYFAQPDDVLQAALIAQLRGPQAVPLRRIESRPLLSLEDVNEGLAGGLRRLKGFNESLGQMIAEGQPILPRALAVAQPASQPATMPATSSLPQGSAPPPTPPAQSTPAPTLALTLPQAAARFRDLSSATQARLNALEQQPIDYAALQAYARDRGQQGEDAMLTALAAQYAGERFNPIQVQALKTAASAQDPIKLSGGIITADGKFVRDPEAVREREVKRLTDLAQFYEQRALTATTESERIEDRRVAEQARVEAQKVAQNFREEIEAGRRQDRQDRREDANRREAERLEERRERRDREDRERKQRDADSLRTEYNRRAEKVRAGASFAQNVLTALADPAVASDATKQTALIFSFGKMLDPESVVRESEQQLIANSRGLFETAQSIVPRIQFGVRLSPRQLQSMREIAQALNDASGAQVGALDQQYRDIATRRGLELRDIFPTPSQPPPGAVRPKGG
jgi:hypothetical protein